MRRQLVQVDFGVDIGQGSEHKLLVIDVTPQQWEQIKNKKLDLPSGWELDDAVEWPIECGEGVATRAPALIECAGKRD